MIRVLHLSSTIDRRDGRMSVIMSVYRKLNRNQIQFDFLVTESDFENYEEEIHELGGNVYYVPSSQMTVSNMKKKMDKILSEKKYDFVHYHAISKWGAVLSVARKHGLGVIVHSHATKLSDKWWKSIRNRFFSYNVLFADKKVAVSPEAGRKLFMSNDYIYIPNMIQYEKFSFDQKMRQKIRKNLGIADDEILIGSVGRISKQKNQQFAVKALHKLIKNKSDKYKLVFIGDDSTNGKVFLKKLRRLVSSLKLTEKVIFTGMVKNVSDYYSALDVMWMPSLYERLPTAGLEAQANGLPILLADTISKSTDITGDVIFLGIKARDVPTWASVTNKLEIIRDKKALVKIENSDFSEKRVMEKWLKLYGE